MTFFVEPQKKTPDLPFPVVGWKGFLQSKWGPRSNVGHVLWQPVRPLRATCSRFGWHHAPKEGCSCGFYIAKKKGITYGYGPIIGRVQGWGKVIEHTQGYRVEYAQLLDVEPRLYTLRYWTIRLLLWTIVGAMTGGFLGFALGMIVLYLAILGHPGPGEWLLRALFPW